MPQITASNKYLTYVLIELLPLGFVILSVLTCLAFIQQVGKYFDVIFPSVGSAQLVVSFLLNLAPNIILVTIPIALAIGAVIVCSRLSNDNEFLAFQAAGFSWGRIVAPFFVLGLIGSIMMAYLSITLVPLSLQKMRNLKEQILLREAGSAIKPRTFITTFPRTLFFVRDVNLESGLGTGIFLLWDFARQDTLHLLIAKRGLFTTPSPELAELEAQMYECTSLEYKKAARPERISLETLELQSSSTSEKLVVKFLIERDAINRIRPIALAEMSFLTVSQLAASSKRSQAVIEWHKRIAFPFSCLLLTVISFLVSTTGSRFLLTRSRIVAISLSLALIYYSLFIVGQDLAISRLSTQWVGVWGANITFAAAIILIVLNRRSVSKSSLGRVELLSNKRGTLTSPTKKTKSTLRIFKLVPFNLISFLFVSEIIRYFLLSLLSLIVTLLIFTLFDLIPAISKNRVPYSQLFYYLALLLPQLIYVSTPFALILGLLISLGVLFRTQELLIFFAAGQSRVRLSLLIMLVASVAGFCLYCFSEYVLPYANRVQDIKHRLIKGKQREEVATAFDRSWVYGKNDVIYSYEWIDGNNTFGGLAAYKLKNDQRGSLYIATATQAVQVSNSLWRLEDKIEKQSDLKQSEVLSVQHSPFLIIEDDLEIFKPTENESTKITSKQLANRIARLRNLGLDTINLRIDLARRTSFPASCLTLALLALPLIFSRAVGWSGTPAYIGLGVGIGLSFWLTMNFFEAIGRQYWLPISLAIWAPQIIFSNIGIYLSLYKRHQIRKNLSQ